jgi:hypothetical protein
VTYFDDLVKVINTDQALLKQVVGLADLARNATHLDDGERTTELGREIERLFTQPVPLIETFGTPLGPIARLLRLYMNHVDTDALGRYYLNGTRA